MYSSISRCWLISSCSSFLIFVLSFKLSLFENVVSFLEPDCIVVEAFFVFDEVLRTSTDIKLIFDCSARHSFILSSKHVASLVTCLSLHLQTRVWVRLRTRHRSQGFELDKRCFEQCCFDYMGSGRQSGRLGRTLLRLRPSVRQRHYYFHRNVRCRNHLLCYRLHPALVFYIILVVCSFFSIYLVIIIFEYKLKSINGLTYTCFSYIDKFLPNENERKMIRKIQFELDQKIIIFIS